MKTKEKHELSGLTVAEIRRLGLAVRVTHERNIKIANTKNFDIKTIVMSKRQAQKIGFKDGVNGRICPNGGKTTVEIKYQNKEYRGVSICHEIDAFNRKLGLARALGKAIQEIVRGGEQKSGVYQEIPDKSYTTYDLGGKPYQMRVN